jgi:hypothetical protein
MAETYLAPDGRWYPADAEPTQQGLQLVLDGVKPATMKNKLEWLLAQPLQPRKRQKTCDIGLFDTESRKQMDLFASCPTNSAKKRD